MKVIIEVFILFVIVGLSKGEPCNCVSYLISENGLSSENKISGIKSDIEDVTCDGNGVLKCKESCEAMYRQLTDNGRTCLKLPGEDKRVGDWMCESLQRDVCNARVGVFAESCGSDAIDTGFRFIETICCKSGFSVHC